MADDDNKKLTANSITEWQNDDPYTFACIIPNIQVLGGWFFSRDITINPNHAALLVVNGEIRDVMRGGNVSIAGILNIFTSRSKANDQVSLMMMDVTERILHFRCGIDRETVKRLDKALSTQQIEATGKNIVTPARYQQKSLKEFEAEKLEAKSETKNALEQLNKEKPNVGKIDWEENHVSILTKDKESVVFDVRITLNFTPEKAGKIYELFHPREYINNSYLNYLIRDEMEQRVFIPRIGQCMASELRGNREILSDLKKNAEEELFAWLNQYGMICTRLLINPAITDAEKVDVINKEKEALEQIAVRTHRLDLERGQREHELLLQQERLAAHLEKAVKENDEETQAVIRRTLLADSENKLSDTEILSKIETLKAETQLAIKEKEQELTHKGVQRDWELEREKRQEELRLELEKTRTIAEIENEKLKAKADIDMKLMLTMAEQHRENEKHKAILQYRLAEREDGHIERMAALAAEKGVLTGDVTIEMFRQATIRKALDKGDASTAAVSQAEGQRHSKEAFRQGLASAPGLGIAAQGKIVLQSTQPQLSSNMQPPYSTQAIHAIPQPESFQDAKQVKCANCGFLVDETAKFCSGCGAHMKE